MILIIILGRLFLFPSSFLIAGGTIHGKVVEKSSGNPLPGAHVRIAGSSQGTFTDRSGNYSLFCNGTGKTKITASFLGYSKSEQIVIVTVNQDNLLDFEMVPAMIESSEVEITDHAVQKNVQETPVRMNTIDIQYISQTPGPSVTNVLELVSGVNLNTTQGIFASNSVITLRGMSGNDQARTLVLMDGIPINKSDEGSVNWNLLNRDNIDHIDVIKGPGPAQYGSNAMGGIINIVSRRPSTSLTGNATFEYGTFNTFGFHYSIAGKLKPSFPEHGFYYNLTGFYRKSDGYNPEIPEYLDKADTFNVNTYLREASIGFKAGYLFNVSNSLEVDVNFFNDKRGRGMMIYEISGAYDKHDTYQVMARYYGKKDNWKWNINVYTLQEYFHRLNEYMSDGEYNLLMVKSQRSDIGLTSNVSLKAGRHHQFMAGLDYRQGSVAGHDIYYTSTDLVNNFGKSDLSGAFIQDEISLFHDKIQINAGVRCNYATFHNGVFTIENPSPSFTYLGNFQDTLIPKHHWFDLDPKLSIQYRFTGESRIYLAATEGFRAPNLDDLCRTSLIQNGVREYNPGLNPEKIMNFELGSDLLFLNKIHVSPSIYYTSGKDFMYNINTGQTVSLGYKRDSVFQKRNISRVDITGAEVDIDYGITKNLALFANYSWSESKIIKIDVNDTMMDKNLTGKNLIDVPSHKAVAGINWKNKILSVNCIWKYTGRRWINDLNKRDFYLGKSEYPDYSTFDLRVWHTFFNHFTLALNINNIFDKLFIDDHLQKSPGRMIMIELSGKF